MKLNIIPFAHVLAALEAADAVDQETDVFNSHFHTHTEIAAVVPEPPGSTDKHVYPDLTASNFSHWIDLIASSQRFHEWHEIILPMSLAQELLDANTIWTLTGKEIRDDAMEDLLARFPKRTTKGISIKVVFDGQKEWFLRLDFCSTKDANGEGGKRYASSVRQVEEALQRICASKRAARAIEHIILRKAPGPARLLFVPHNKHMDTSREFRVFCPPVWTLSALSNEHRRGVTSSMLSQDAVVLCPLNGVEQDEKQETASEDTKPLDLIQQTDEKRRLGRVTAISQYRWHSRYHRPSTAEQDAEKALAAAQSIYSNISTHAASSLDPAVLQKLRAEGFVFDIFEASNGEMQLLEINPFGAMSGCGSCLFHWIEDGPLLYGAQEEVEVRLTM